MGGGAGARPPKYALVHNQYSISIPSVLQHCWFSDRS